MLKISRLSHIWRRDQWYSHRLRATVNGISWDRQNEENRPELRASCGRRHFTAAATSNWNSNRYRMSMTLTQHRCMSSNADESSEGMMSSLYSDYVSDYIPSSKMIWGGTGWLLETLHMDGMVPYSLCFVGTNLIVRTALIPLVIKGAKTAAHLATVAPEIQFLVTLFQRDFAQLRKQHRPLQEQIYLLRITWQTLRQIYKLHKVSPLDVFKSPLLQLPFFWYVSIDIRKIINGANPELAQKLTESPYLFYGMDLTEADPYYGLPILGGALLYLNVEMAMGKRALSGETSSKSNIAIYLKDFFQSLAVFMPCFMAHSPAGVQIYLATSFVFTLGQGMALRNDDIRQMIGLPAMNAPRSQGKLATKFINLKQKEKEEKEARKDDEIIYGAHGILAPGWESSFVGTQRPSTILIDENDSIDATCNSTSKDIHH